MNIVKVFDVLFLNMDQWAFDVYFSEATSSDHIILFIR